MIPSNANKKHELFSKQLRSGKIPACTPMTSVYLILHGNEMLSLSTKLVSLDLEMGQNIPFYLFASAWLCGSASKWALETWC